MLGEAVNTGRPLYIFDVGDGARPWWALKHGYRYKPLSHRLAMRFAPRRMRRDIGNIQDALVGSGAARWLTSETIPGAAELLKARLTAAATESVGAVAREELQRSAQAVRRLVADR